MFRRLWILTVLLLAFTLSVSAQDEVPAALADDPRAMAMTPDGRFLYVIHADTGALGVYSVEPLSGIMERIPGSPFAVSGNAYRPLSLAMHPDGSRLFIVNSGNIGDSALVPITVFNLDRASGVPTEAASSPLALISEGAGLGGAVVSPDGRRLYVSNTGMDRIEVIALQGVTDAPTTTLTVAATRTLCVGMTTQFCYQVTDENGETTLFYDAIDGFEYQWGYETRLRVRVEPIANPPADSSDRRYALVEVLRREAVGLGQSFTLSPPGDALQRNGDGYTIYGEARFTCAPELDCAGLDALTNAPDILNLTLRIPDDGRQTLQLLAYGR